MRAHEQTIYGNTQHTTHWKTITTCNTHTQRESRKFTEQKDDTIWKLFLGITHSPIFIDLRRCRPGQRCVAKPLLLPKFLTKQNDSPTILLTILNIHCTCFEVMWFDPLMKVIHCQLCMFRKYKFENFVAR